MIHVWTISDRPGAALFIGVRPGRQRPEMWIAQTNAEGQAEVAVLASFHGDKQMQATINFLDAMGEQITRAVIHHRTQGDTE